MVDLPNSTLKDTKMHKPKQCQIDTRSLADTLQVIGGKWKMLILGSIFNGATRFSEIEHDLPGITKKMLSKELKELEANLLISKTTFPDMPTKAEYRPTPYSLELAPLINEMGNWGKNHRQVVFGK